MRNSFCESLMLLTTFAVSGMAGAAQTESYPSRPVRIVAPFAPGGGSDLLARLVAQKLSTGLGQSVIVDNRPGGSGIIGMEIVARAAPDGHTIAIVTGSIAASSSLRKTQPFDLNKDFAAITQATTQPYVLVVHQGTPAKNVKELVAQAKLNPDTIRYGSSGPGTVQHFSGVLLTMLADIKLLHVPYKGGAPALNDLLGGQIQMAFINYVQLGPHLKSGRVRALAVTTDKRSPSLPDLPAIAETVPGYGADNWYGFVAPSKVSAAILTRLHTEISKVLLDPQTREKLNAEAAQVVASKPQAFAALIRADIDKWSKVVVKSGIKVE